MTTTLADDRDAALEVGYKATDWQNNFSFDDYKKALSDWEIKGIYRNDVIIGAAYFKDGEVHVSVLPEWRRRWVTRGLLKQLFADKNSFTRIMPGHEYMYDIFTRLGFVTNNDGKVVKGEHCGY